MARGGTYSEPALDESEQDARAYRPPPRSNTRGLRSLYGDDAVDDALSDAEGERLRSLLEGEDLEDLDDD